MVYIKFCFLTITECNISISLETKCRGVAVLRKTTLWCPVVSCSPNGMYLQFFIRFYQARNKLGTPGVAKSFLKSAQIFQTMFNTFFQGGGRRPPWLRTWVLYSQAQVNINVLLRRDDWQLWFVPWPTFLLTMANKSSKNTDRTGVHSMHD